MFGGPEPHGATLADASGARFQSLGDGFPCERFTVEIGDAGLDDPARAPSSR